ncbi:MAG: hypothetical protein ACRC92_27225 [Peptostreptococcaceae bacterium]
MNILELPVDIRAKDVKSEFYSNLKDGLDEKECALLDKPNKAYIIRFVNEDEYDAELEAASERYMRNKITATNTLLPAVDIQFIHYSMDNSFIDVDIENMIAEVKELLKGAYAIVQKPLPRKLNNWLNGREITDLLIDHNYDIDCAHSLNFGKFCMDPLNVDIMPCTVGAIRDIIMYINKTNILSENEIGRSGSAVVIGRSNIVGKPAALLLQSMGYTVTVVHSQTDSGDLSRAILGSELIVSASGNRNILNSNMIDNMYYNGKGYEAIIDVGINMDDNGKLCGDVDYDAIMKYNDGDSRNIVRHITPVPGGVGPLTVANFVKNLKMLILRNR